MGCRTAMFKTLSALSVCWSKEGPNREQAWTHCDQSWTRELGSSVVICVGHSGRLFWSSLVVL